MSHSTREKHWKYARRLRGWPVNLSAWLPFRFVSCFTYTPLLCLHTFWHAIPTSFTFLMFFESSCTFTWWHLWVHAITMKSDTPVFIIYILPYPLFQRHTSCWENYKFPGHSWLWFLIACSMQNGGRRPGKSYHMIHGTADITGSRYRDLFAATEQLERWDSSSREAGPASKTYLGWSETAVIQEMQHWKGFFSKLSLQKLSSGSLTLWRHVF